MTMSDIPGRRIKISPFVVSAGVSVAALAGFVTALTVTDTATATDAPDVTVPAVCLEALDAAAASVTQDKYVDRYTMDAIAVTDGLMPALGTGDAKKIETIIRDAEASKRDASEAVTDRDEARVQLAKKSSDCYDIERGVTDE